MGRGDGAALRRFDQLGEGPATPGYAIVAAAVSARRSGQPGRAARLYALALARGEDGAELRRGLALLEPRRGRSPPDAAVAASDARRPFNALALLGARLAGGADDRPARRLRVLALEQAGAPALALADARRDPGLLDAVEMRRLQNGAAAFLVRWGGNVAAALPPEDPAHRFAGIDRALAALDGLIPDISPGPRGGAG